MATSLFYTVQNKVSIQLLKPEYKQQLYRVVKQLFDRFKQGLFIIISQNYNFQVTLL